MNQQLGAAVSAVNRVVFPDVDWRLAAYGDCVRECYRYQLRLQDEVAKSFGFRDLSHLRAEVERRTSGRWAYFNLPWETPVFD